MKLRLRINHLYHRFGFRLVSLLLTNALLLPLVFLDSNNKVSARTNFPSQQTAPASAPAEPYVFSAPANMGKLLPAINKVITPVAESYSAVAAFIFPETPEGLGAATPPASFTERFTGFMALLLFPPAGKVKETNESALSETSPASTLLPSCYGRYFDFDGDCKADVGRWQPNSFQFKISNSGSSGYTTLNLGSSSSKIAPADFDGDGLFDRTVFSAGAWTVRKSSNNTDWNVSWGTTGDLPYPADYDGDGIADFCIYRPSTNTFWVLTSSSSYGSYTSTAFGTSGDLVVPGNFDGDTKADYAVFRPSNGHWFYLPSSGGSYVETAWGVSTDIPAPGDFDGDGKTDHTVFRPSTGVWYVLKSSGGSPNYTETTWGNLGDQPVPADYDNDGKTDKAIYRPTTGEWWISKSSGGSPNYIVHALGTGTDIAVPSAYLKQSGAALYPDQLSPARLAPINSTGGTNLYSRNSGWGTGLVGLAGRSGLNLNIGMSYNSLVWTKVGSVMAFDMDRSNLAPGFNFGFPRIEAPYVSSQTSTLSYLMVSTAGARIEFRQTAASDTYETADSSFSQIKVNNPGSSNSPTAIEDITLTVTNTDGTQMSYSWIGNAYRCTQVKDRNGNYITISNSSDGRLTSVTDTLGRVVTVNYDSYLRPSSITQNWQTSNGSSSTTTTHNWATFTYTTKTISTSFDSSLSVYGPANSTSISVLQKVKYADDSYTLFDYNDYGQVYKISKYAKNDGLLNYVWRNIESPSSNQTDCPRFTQTKTKVTNFNGSNEVTVNNTFTTGQTYTLPDSSTPSGTRIEIKTPDSTGASDALVTKIYSPSSGWAESLPVLVESWATESSTLTKKRWTWTIFTQENTGLSYIKNPRVSETQILDGTSTKRTTVGYLMQSGSSTTTQYGLVNKIESYASNQSTVLKTQTTEYNLGSNYVSRRIIGLPATSKLYEGTDSSGTLVSKITFDHDESGYTGSGQSVTATQHDATNYGSGFSYRGNLTRTRRWDVNSSTNESLSVSSQIKYNIAGSAISTTDPRGRVNTISYTDSWNDSVSRSATYAYATTITDSGGNAATVKYRYDFGENVWARSPMPSGTGNSYGKTTSRTYSDTTGRITKETIDNSGAYTRYEYPDDNASLNTYSTIVDANNNNDVDSGDEIQTETLFDGAGRIRKTRTKNPGSYGQWTGKLIEYNILGQVKRETVPTEITSSYVPAGDDDRGTSGGEYVWLWKSVEYDWKGRVTKEINTDGTDRLYSYEGCGCAGNQVTTIKGEVTTATDVSGTQQTTKRRTQKVYQDILGRATKTEIWDLDGGGSAPFSTVVNTYNGRDQITNIREYSGADTSSTYQDTTMTYDGHGRLSARHRPEEFDSSTSPATLTDTNFTYHADDTIASVTDPRDAVTNYFYGYYDDSSSSEYRTLLTKITYSAPTGIVVPGNVTFTYDAAGNRTYMADDSGNLTYSYDELSRLKEETKNFADTLTDAPSGGYKLKYTYHLTGGIKSIEDPFGAVVNYGVDETGRTTTIGGSGFYDEDAEEEIIEYASDLSYRAFGGLKSMTYATAQPTQLTMGYNTRLLPSTYEADSDAVSGDIQNVTYSYFNDGQVKEAVNSVDNKFSQYYTYDFAARLKTNIFGTSQSGYPYTQTLGFDAFSNITSRNTSTWGTQRNFTASYTNNRKVSGGYQSSTDTFDAAGNIVSNYISGGPTNHRWWKFDAAGRVTEWLETLPYISSLWDQGAIMTFDGDGRVAKRISRNRNRTNGNTDWIEKPEYGIYSSITGKKITDLKATGAKYQTFVYGGSAVIAEQRRWVSGHDHVVFRFKAPITGSTTASELSGELSTYGPDSLHTEALGAVLPPQEEEVQYPAYQHGGWTQNPEDGCMIDWIPAPCSNARQALATGNGVLGPLDQWVRVKYNAKNVYAFYRYYADGYAGYVPQNARYIGRGVIEPVGPVAPARDRRNFDTNFSELNQTGDKETDLRFEGTEGFWRLANGKGRTQVDDSLLDTLRSLIANALNTPECKAFIDKFVGGEDLLRVFDLARVQQGFAYNPSVNSQHADGLATSVVTGGLNDGGGFDLNTRYASTQTSLGGGANLFNVNLAAELVLTFIHELIHISAPGRGDTDMANVLEANGVKLTIPPNQRITSNAISAETIASMNWGPELEKACKITPEMLMQWLTQ